MIKTQHSRTLKIALITMAVFIGIMDAKSVSWKDSATEELNLFATTELSVTTDVDIAMSLLKEAAVSMMSDSSGLVCPDDITTYTDLNSCEALISSGLNILDPENTIASLSWQMTGATEAASNNTGINQISSYLFNEGTTVITYRGTTLYNNLINCTFTVTVSDNQVPRLENPQEDITVNADAGDCYAFVNWANPVVSDNCASPEQILVSGSHEPGTSFPVGTTVVNYSINDGVEYNTVEHSFLITVVDEEEPEIFAPHATTVNCGDPIPDAFTSWQQFADAGGMAFDNCNIDFNSFKYEGQQSSGIRCPYTVTRTYSIADADGNMAEIEHIIYVGEEAEEEAPVVLKSGMAGYTTVKSGNWNDPTVWSGGVVPTVADNVTILSTHVVTVDAAAECDNITIDAGGSLNHGGSLATTLQVNGNWTNNGNYNGGTNGIVAFVGAGNASISGATNFEGLVINKSDGLSSTITINNDVTVLSSGSLTMTSGLVTIPASGSLAINPSNTLDIDQNSGFDVLGGDLSTGNFSVTNEGLIRIASGSSVSFGTNSGNEVHTQFDGAFIVTGGTVSIAGRLYNSAAGTLDSGGLNLPAGISISAGTVTLCTIGNGASSTGSLHVTSSAYFDFSGGTIVFQNPSTASTELDLGLLSGTGTKNTTGGTFQFGNASTPPNSSFNISSEIPVDRITSSANADLVLEGDLIVNDLSLNNATSIDLNGNSLIQTISGTGTYSFPLDDGSGNDVSVEITINSVSSYGSNPYIEITTTDGKYGNNASSSDFLSRYWTITFNDINGPNYSLSANYPSVDVSGTESEIAAGVWTGSTPWIKGNQASGNTISATGLSGNGTIILSGITLDAPTVEINNGAASEEICNGASVVLTAVPTGDPGWTYAWSPSAGLSATTIANPTASPSSNTTYTVTVTDGNGFTASDDIDVIVHPIPDVTPTPASETICSGDATNIALSGSVTGTAFNWTVSQSGVTGATNGSGTSIAQTLTATGTTPGTVTYSITPSANGCTGTTVDVTVTVNPEPSVNTVTDQELCHNESTTAITFAGTATDFQWTNDNPSIGLAGSGTGNIAAFTAINTSGTPEVATITVTPIYSNGGETCSGTTEEFTITVNPIVHPAVQITIVGSATICEGETAEFTSNVTGTGVYTPTYQWQINGVDVPNEDGTTFSYSNFNNGDKVTLDVWTDAPCSQTGTAFGYTMTVNPTVIPSVSVNYSSDDICDGETVTFEAIVINPGPGPTYQWYVNGVAQALETSATFVTSSLADNDAVHVEVVSNANCADQTPVASTPVPINVSPILVPDVTISADNTSICPGETITFTVDSETHPGTNPSYQWKVNGINVGTDLPTYSTASLSDGDYVTVEMTSNARCASPAAVLSNQVDIIVLPGTPAIPAAITGNNAVCPATTETYTIASVADATTYTWTVPAGWSIVSGQNSETITVTTGGGGTSGNISVTAGNSCETSAARTLAVNVGTLSSPATAISNPNDNTCEGTSKTLTLSGGSLGTGAQWVWYETNCGTGQVGTGTSITVNPSPGTYTYWVRAEGTCDTTACYSVDVTVSPGAPAQPTAIFGNTPLCPTTTDTYYIESVPNADSYAWSVPGGWSYTVINDTTIEVTSGAFGQNGNITVTAINSCGTSTAQTLAVTVAPGIPDTPGDISGDTAVCAGDIITYSVDPVPNATRYNWSFPSGWTYSVNDTTNSISVTTSSTSGAVTVTAENQCGESLASTVSVAAYNTTPATPVFIETVTAVCPSISAFYRISPVANANNYTWTVPAGWIIESGQSTTTLSVTVPGGASSGNVEVTADNPCGSSTAAIENVTVSTTGTVYAGPDQFVCSGTRFVYMEGEISGAISKKGDWNWESITYPENHPQTVYFDDGDELNTLFNFPDAFTSGTAYIRIYTTSSVSGCGYLSDTMAISILPLPTAVIASVDTICSGSTATVTVIGTPNSTLTYRVNLDVAKTTTIDDSGEVTITTDALTADATFRLLRVVYNDYSTCQQVLDTTATILVNPLATVDAGEDQTLCALSPVVSLAGTVGGGASSVTWSGGTGIFSDVTDLNATYTPTTAEINAGTLTLTLTSEDPAGPCGTAIDQMTIAWDEAATVNAGPKLEMCSDGTVTLAGSIGGSATSATWTGGGTFSPDATTLNAVYTPSAAEAASDSFQLVLNTNNPAGVCGALSDTVWVIVYPGATVNAGNDTTICASSFAVLSGSFGGGATSVSWSGGNGTFAPNNTTPDAVYTPSADEIADGSVTLTLTSNDPTGPCDPVTDQVTITIDEAPTVNAGIDDRVCEGSTIILNGAIGGSATSATWSSISSLGSFSDATALNPVYTHEPGYTGADTLILTTNDPLNNCGFVVDTMILTIDTSIGVSAGNDTMICSDATITLDGWVESGTGTWSTSGTGSFSDVNDANAVYTPSNGDIFNETITLTFTTQDPGGDCGPAADDMVLTIKEIITITTQPVNTGVCATDTAELFVQAVGDNLTYQWYYADGTAVTNSAVINGAQTATLQFTNATSANMHEYYVLISSPTACDTEYSDTISLNVDEAIQVLNSFLSDSICEGENVMFWLEAIPGGSLSYQWRLNGVDLANGGNISGADNDTLIISNATAADAGAYSVYLSGLAGYTCADAQSTPGTLVVIEDGELLPVDQSATFCLDKPIDTLVYTVNNGVTDVSVSSGSWPAGLSDEFDAATGRYLIYGTPTVSGTYTFTLTTTGFCAPATATGTIVINDALTAPVVSADQFICYNSTPATLTLSSLPSGGSGPYAYQWQDSTDGGNWAFITGAGTDTYSPSALTETTWYRVVAYDTGFPSCDSVISAAITIVPEDILAPTFTPPGTFTQTANAACEGLTHPDYAGYPSVGLYNDNCAPDTFLINHTTYYDHDTIAGSCGSSYSFTRTWVVTDEAGNIAEDDQVINVEDKSPPQFTWLPSDTALTCIQDTSPASLGGYATAIDNCDNNVVVSYYNLVTQGACTGSYTIDRYWIATDACSNADTIRRRITVVDNVAPVILNNGDTTVLCVGDIPVASSAGIEFYDECSATQIELIDEIAHDLDNESGYCPFQVVRTWRVTDECNNSTEFEQTIYVVQDASCPACSECLYNNTLHVADFLNQPYTDTTFYDVVKNDKCCGAENEPGAQNLFCASFKVRLDDGAVGVEILIDHVTPPGQDWQLDCTPIDGGDVVCLPAGRFHLFTFCKHAQANQPQNNDYTFRQVYGVIASGDIETREECDEVLSVTGEFSNPVWTSIYPGGPGDYDHLLSSTTDTIVRFNAPLDLDTDHIQYKVCGDISATLCDNLYGGELCDTVDVFIRDAISVELNINPDLICEDYIPTVSPTIYPAGVYDLEWYIGATPSGTPVSTSNSYTPLTGGWYSIVVIDNTTGLGCNRDTFSFEMNYDYTGPTIRDIPPPLVLECNSTGVAQQISDWLAIPEAEYVNEVGDTIQFTPGNDYYDGPGVTMICGDTVMVTFNAQDQCSNDTLAYGYIYVTDTTMPVITPASDSTIQCSTTDPDQDPGFLSWIANHGGATATDLCDPDLDWTVDTASTTWTGDPANNQRTVTFTATDDCGNWVSTTATFSVIDTVPPSITCPDDVAEIADPDLCGKTPDSPVDPTYSDDCSDPVLSWSSTGALDSIGGLGTVANVVFPVGVTTVTYFVTDDAGLTNDCSFTVTIVDTVPPEINITGCSDVTETMDADDCFVIPTTIADPDYSDNCWPKDSLELTFVITGALDTAGYGSVVGILFPVGVSTVIYTVTDPDGNEANCSFTVTMLRDEIPWTAITCPTDPPAVTLGPTECERAITLDPPTIEDYCVTATYTITNDFNNDSVIINEVFPVGTTEVNWIITDNSNNVDTCTVYVEVNGVQLPWINCPVDVSGTMTSDNCFVVPPTIGSPSYGAPCWPTDSLDLTFRIENGVWDTTGVGEVNGLEFPAGTSTVWYIIEDPDGNKDSCDFTVAMLRDAIPGTAIICPPDPAPQTLGATECDVTLSLPAPTFSETCTTVVYTVTNNINGTSTIVDETFDVGITRVVWTITDNSGNVDSCINIVEVNGIQLPYINCPLDVSGTMTSDNCFALPPTIGSPNYGAPCWPPDSLDLTFRIENGVWDTTGVGEVNGLEFPAGTNTVWYIVEDPDGNKDSCDFTVTMLRDAIPSTAINCPPDPAPYVLGATECDVTMTLPPPTFNETCTTVVYTVTNNYNNDSVIIDETFPVGITEVIWIITDNSGNVDSCINIVDISGIQLPTINCPPSVTGPMSADDCEALPPVLGLPTYEAPCWPDDSLDISYTISSEYGNWDTAGTGFIPTDLEFPVGTNTVWYIVTDPDGNQDSCDFTVTMQQDDISWTVYTCPPNPADEYVDSFSCDTWIDILPPTINDHCLTASYSINHNSIYAAGTDSTDASGYYPIGEHTITWTISDNSGNDTTCVQTFEVLDLEPVLECPPSIEVFADENELFATGITVGLPRYQDNCDSTLIYTVIPPDSVTTVYDSDPSGINLLTGPHTYDLGVTTIWYIFEDGHNHIDSCFFTVTVLAAPDIECPPDTTIWLDGTEDDCSVTFDPGVADLIEGAPPITWTYTINFADGSTEGPITYTKDASDPYANPLGNRTFPLGVTTIEWRAENDAGFDTCSHWIEVIDTIPPTFTTAPYENCVDMLFSAVYDPVSPNPFINHIDPNLEKNPSPDQHTFISGDTSLDLLTLEDNCCDSTEMTINWRIEFTPTPNPLTAAPDITYPDINGTGQPSIYGANILMPGDGVYFNDVVHHIYYWVTDCNGNATEEVMEEITITPRPQIIKQN